MLLEEIKSFKILKVTCRKEMFVVSVPFLETKKKGYIQILELIFC